jgi:hypothetical protein
MQKMNPNDPQVVLWTMWDGLTSLAPAHMTYGAFDHGGQSGGSRQPFTPRTETHLFGVKMGWWEADPSEFVVYHPTTVLFMAAQAVYFADEIPN